MVVVDLGMIPKITKPGDPCTPTGKKSNKRYKRVMGHFTLGEEEVPWSRSCES